jgi:hypothetical protein
MTNQLVPSQSNLERAIAEWAQTRPYLKAAWLYGSRIPGSGKMPQENSDWDLAIQIEGDNPEQIKAWWFDNLDNVHKELEGKIGWSRSHREAWKGIHVEMHNPPLTPNVSRAVEDYAVLVYTKCRLQ